MAVLHQGMPHVAELGRLPVALLVELCLRVGRTFVRLVGALLLMEVPLGVTARSLAIIIAAILLPEALDRGPCLDQRTVHRKVIVRQQQLYLGLSQNRSQELR